MTAELGLMTGGEKGAATQGLRFPPGVSPSPKRSRKQSFILASPVAMVNGANLAIDGGYTIR